MPSLPRECGGNRWPWSNGAIILLNVAMMFATIANARLVPPLEMDVHRLTLWRFVSYAFVHESWPHLLFNMIALYVLGNPINQRFGQIGYLAFYLAGAIAAAIGFLMVGGEAMIGASGAVGAVIGAYLALLPRSNIRIFIGVGTLQVRSMYLLIIFFLYNVLMSVASRLGATGGVRGACGRHALRIHRLPRPAAVETAAAPAAGCADGHGGFHALTPRSSLSYDCTQSSRLAVQIGVTCRCTKWQAALFGGNPCGSCSR